MFQMKKWKKGEFEILEGRMEWFLPRLWTKFRCVAVLQKSVGKKQSVDDGGDECWRMTSCWRAPRPWRKKRWWCRATPEDDVFLPLRMTQSWSTVLLVLQTALSWQTLDQQETQGHPPPQYSRHPHWRQKNHNDKNHNHEEHHHDLQATGLLVPGEIVIRRPPHRLSVAMDLKPGDLT